MQAKLVKIGLILLLVIGTTGCSETVYLSTDHGTQYIKVISNWEYIIRVIVGWLVLLVGWGSIALAWYGYYQGKKANIENPTPISVYIGISIIFIIIFCSVGSLLIPDVGSVTLNEFRNNPQWVAASHGYDLKVQIDKVKTNIASLKQDREQKVLPLKQNYSQMYNQYYPQLAQQLPGTGIRNHEELLKNCEQYLELCSSLNRVAKLQYYIGKLDDKLKQIGANIIKLDDNVFDMERTFELSQIFSDEELEGVEKLIEETKGKIDSQVPPPEKQDVAGLEPTFSRLRRKTNDFQTLS